MIKNINLINIRNHENLKLSFDKKFIYIKGLNGSGKTTILESIYLASSTKSHRTNNDLELIKYGANFGIINLETTNNKNLKIVISENGKIITKNKVEIKKLSDIIGDIKTVIFSPEDLMLIKGAPSIRRNFIDLELLKLDKEYFNLLSKYKNTLKQRNALLKQMGLTDDLIILNILGKNLGELGIKIMDKRSDFLNLLNKEVNTTYKLFTTNNIKILYEPNLNNNDFLNYLNKEQRKDILYKTTNHGPHRDDFNVLYNDKDSKTASQGEIRLIVLSIKLALLNIIKDKTNDDVILLLDDVLSELDENVKHKFLNNLPTNTQIIMNSAIDIKDYKNIQVIDLEGVKNV